MDDLLILAFIAVFVLNGLWLWMKFTLQDNGYPVSWFWNHFQDLPNILHYISSMEERSRRRKHFIGLFVTIVTSVTCFALGIASIPLGFEEENCNHESQFRITQIDWVVVDKLIDKETYPYETIKVLNRGQLETKKPTVLFRNHNYDRVNIGDTIVKLGGESTVKLHTADGVVNLEIEYRCKTEKN